jgi:hypothetical protein
MRSQVADDDGTGRQSSSVEMRDTSATEGLVNYSFEHSEGQGLGLRSELKKASTDSYFQEQSLSNYLLNHREYSTMLCVCGGLHIPLRMNYNDITMNAMNIWRVFLIFTVVLQIVYSVYQVIVEVQIASDRGLIIFMWPFCIALQSLLVFPVITVSSHRMQRSIQLATTRCLQDTFVVCYRYLMVSMVLWVVYALVMIYDYSVLIKSGSGPPSWSTVGTAAALGAITYCGLLSTTLLSTWAVFFMVLDAKVVGREIEVLTELADAQRLTVRLYREAHARCSEGLAASRRLSDAVVAVSALCVLSFSAVCVSFNASVTRRLDILVLGFCALAREAFLLLCVLPDAAVANAAMDCCARLLAEKEWQQEALAPTSSSNSADLGSGLTCRNTLGSVVSISNIYANNSPNVVCLRLWAMCNSTPLHIDVLGRTVGLSEVRLLLVAVFVSMIGSFAAYLWRTE